jgi:hypothetical protein
MAENDELGLLVVDVVAAVLGGGALAVRDQGGDLIL